MSSTTTTARIPPDRLRAIAAYLAFRAIPLDPQVVLTHFEQTGITEDLFTIEADFYALLDRFAEQVGNDFLPTRDQQRRATRLTRAAFTLLIEHIETGRIDGRAAQLDDDGCGCVLAIFAALIDSVDWTTLRYDDDIPLLSERFIWHVRPGETHHTCPTLAIVHEWTLRALGYGHEEQRNRERP